MSSADGPPLGEGTRDLGEIRLARAGAIRGLVTDEAGAPLADVELNTGPESSQTYERGAHTNFDGTYLISHAVVGTYGVEAKREGFLHVFQAPITVAAGRDTLGVDFVLRAAPVIEGIVVDEHDRPIEGAKLRGWPLGGAAGAGSKSGADGRFVVHLPQEDSYRSSVERDGYVTWDEGSDDHTTLGPGERDVRIALRLLARTRFLVVDSKSGAPIERFGFGILENNGSRSTRYMTTEERPPRISERSGGVVEGTARPGVDQYIVAAEGYLLAYDDVEHALATEPSQTIRLRRCGVVRGRVVRGGAVVADASVLLIESRRARDRVPRPQSAGEWRDRFRRPLRAQRAGARPAPLAGRAARGGADRRRRRARRSGRGARARRARAAPRREHRGPRAAAARRRSRRADGFFSATGRTT